MIGSLSSGGGGWGGMRCKVVSFFIGICIFIFQIWENNGRIYTLRGNAGKLVSWSIQAVLVGILISN